MEPQYPSTPPPPYSGPNPLPSSAFCLPSFEEIEALSEEEATGCLPAYQARPIRRYHPYRRPVPARSQDETRFYNTVFDEECDLLDLSPLASVVDTPAPVAPSTAVASTALLHSSSSITAHNTVAAIVAEIRAFEERRRRIIRLRDVIPEFILAVKRALAMQSQATHPTATHPPSHAVATANTVD